MGEGEPPARTAARGARPRPAKRLTPTALPCPACRTAKLMRPPPGIPMAFMKEKVSDVPGEPIRARLQVKSQGAPIEVGSDCAAHACTGMRWPAERSGDGEGARHLCVWACCGGRMPKHQDALRLAPRPQARVTMPPHGLEGKLCM